MKVKSRIALAAVVLFLFVACGDEMTDRERGWKMVEDRFAAAAPEVGELAPDVVVLDADGKEHQLRSLLKGNYSVLVLGCLT
jgi:cytochrome oxidase Cu insertion factor (SCO1/SenC/PrrC family)